MHCLLCWGLVKCLRISNLLFYLKLFFMATHPGMNDFAYNNWLFNKCHKLNHQKEISELNRDSRKKDIEFTKGGYFIFKRLVYCKICYPVKIKSIRVNPEPNYLYHIINTKPVMLQPASVSKGQSIYTIIMKSGRGRIPYSG